MEASGLPSTALATLLKHQADLQVVDFLATTFSVGQYSESPAASVTYTVGPNPPLPERVQEASRVMLRTVTTELTKALLDLLVETTVPESTEPRAKAAGAPSPVRQPPNEAHIEPPVPAATPRVRVELAVVAKAQAPDRQSALPSGTVGRADVVFEVPADPTFTPIRVELSQLLLESGVTGELPDLSRGAMPPASEPLQEATDLLDAIRSIIGAIRENRTPGEAIKNDQKNDWIFKALMILARPPGDLAGSGWTSELPGGADGDVRSLLEIYLRAVIQMASRGGKLVERTTTPKHSPAQANATSGVPKSAESLLTESSVLNSLSTSLASRIIRSAPDATAQQRSAPHQFDPSLAARLAALFSARRPISVGSVGRRASPLNRYRTRDISDYVSSGSTEPVRSRRSGAR
jgi:hypothetical protein